MMTQTAAAIVWFAGLAGWYIIRHPFARKAKKIEVRASFYDRRESLLLAFASLGLFVIPAVYVLTGFPALLDRPFIPAIAWLGPVAQCAALWLFRRSHVDLGRNWSISLEVRDHHALVKNGVYRLIRHPMYSSFFLAGRSSNVTAAQLARRWVRTCWRGGPLCFPRKAGRTDDA